MITIVCFRREGKGMSLAYLVSLFRKKNNSIPLGFLSFTKSMNPVPELYLLLKKESITFVLIS